jgi:hypothetical protein
MKLVIISLILQQLQQNVEFKSGFLLENLFSYQVISLSENSSLKLEETNILAFSKNAFKTGNKLSKNMSHPRIVEFLGPTIFAGRASTNDD